MFSEMSFEKSKTNLKVGKINNQKKIKKKLKEFGMKIFYVVV